MSAQVVGSRETSELARTNVKMEQLETDRDARMDGRTNERLAWRGVGGGVVVTGRVVSQQRWALAAALVVLGSAVVAIGSV